MEELIDTNLMLHDQHSINTKNEMMRVVHVALLCTQEASSRRPSMSMALLMLAGEEHLPAPTKPPFMDEKTMELDAMTRGMSPSLDHGITDSVAIISHSIFYPR